MRSAAAVVIALGLVLPASGKKDTKKRVLTRQSQPGGDLDIGDDQDPATGYDHFDHFGHNGVGVPGTRGAEYDYYEWVRDEQGASEYGSAGVPGNTKGNTRKVMKPRNPNRSDHRSSENTPYDQHHFHRHDPSDYDDIPDMNLPSARMKQQKGKRAKPTMQRNKHDQYQYGYGYGYDEDYDAEANIQFQNPQMKKVKKAGMVRNKEDKYQYGYGYGYDADYYAGQPKPNAARKAAKRAAKLNAKKQLPATERAPAWQMLFGCTAALAAVAAVAVWIVQHRPTDGNDSAYGTIKTDELAVSV